jgi:hypothetical protein
MLLLLLPGDTLLAPLLLLPVWPGNRPVCDCCSHAPKLPPLSLLLPAPLLLWGDMMDTVLLPLGLPLIGCPTALLLLLLPMLRPSPSMFLRACSSISSRALRRLHTSSMHIVNQAECSQPSCCRPQSYHLSCLLRQKRTPLCSG